MAPTTPVIGTRETVEQKTTSCNFCVGMLERMERMDAFIAEDRVFKDSTRKQIAVLQKDNAVLQKDNAVLQKDNAVVQKKIAALENKVQRMAEKDAFLEQEIANLNTEKATREATNKAGKKDNLQIQRTYILPMQCIYRRILVTKMREYITQVTNQQPDTDILGCLKWKDFIERVSRRNDVLELTGFSKSRILYLNEAVSPGGEADNESAHQVMRREDLVASIDAISSPEIHASFQAYYDQVAVRSNLIYFSD